ncbi:MAG: NnrS family protein, partial [Rhodospirillales bacterium]|nr:NnrS family protein [Rhodospirillales bacterium]
VAGLVELPSLFDPVSWHAHEMIFGYAMAVASGFFLTAIPNWTGRLPVRGWPLAALALLWLAGRAAVLFSEILTAPVAAVLDLSFPAVFVAVIAREIVAGRNRRNLLMVGLVALLLAGNTLMHLQAVAGVQTAALGERLGLAALLFLIAVVGGRITPSFTRNWLAKRNSAHLPRPFSMIDRAALIVAAAALAAWIAGPEAVMTAWLCLAAAAVLAVRLSRWSGWRTLVEPLLLVLHVGYGWLFVGFALLGLANLTTLVPASAALHALTIGAVGTMTLAVMTRATLGHSGRPLTAGPGTVAIYAMVTVAAALRVVGASFDDLASVMLPASGLFWMVAFGLFVTIYLPDLTGSRRKRSASNTAPP